MTLRISPVIAVIAIAGSAAFASAQQFPASTTPPSAADSSIFAPLNLPPYPSAVRLANGAPGPKYWQNRADYDLHATLDTVTGSVSGTMTMRYTNHSPNTLPFLWLQTEQNAFRRGGSDSLSTRVYGDIIDEFTQIVDGKPIAVQLEEHQSETKATLPRPLRPGEVATLHVTWHFIVPLRPMDPGIISRDFAHAIMSLRMGREGTLYQIAQWYPRVNVYDDVKGWNTEPYGGLSEFFLEYGDFTLAVTVPSNYIVAATGTLDNQQEVLTATERARLAQAAHSDTIVHIITAAELNDGTAHLRHDGMVTWKFHAANVRDAVFATSPRYQWDVTSWKGVQAQAYYRPLADSMWHDVADMARMSIQEYSERWYPYPYPQVSVAEGISKGPVGGGMEYPMISFDAAYGTPSEVYTVITHEVGHNWFPMIVGSNERVHGWMDEGLNTFINSFSEARRYPEHSQEARIGPPTFSGSGSGEYEPPASVLQLLRRDVLGPAVFDKAFRTYIQRWAYKHPTPQDFFRTMDDVAGQHLDWFWREWFYKLPGFDQAIDSVTQATTGDQTHLTVVYGNHAIGVLPLLVRFTFGDGTRRDVAYPADIWRTNKTRHSESYTFPKPVARIELDPDKHLVDTNRVNNVWLAPSAAPAGVP